MNKGCKRQAHSRQCATKFAPVLATCSPGVLGVRSRRTRIGTERLAPDRVALQSLAGSGCLVPRGRSGLRAATTRLTARHVGSDSALARPRSDRCCYWFEGFSRTNLGHRHTLPGEFAVQRVHRTESIEPRFAPTPMGTESQGDGHRRYQSYITFNAGWPKARTDSCDKRRFLNETPDATTLAGVQRRRCGFAAGRIHRSIHWSADRVRG